MLVLLWTTATPLSTFLLFATFKHTIGIQWSFLRVLSNIHVAFSCHVPFLGLNIVCMYTLPQIASFPGSPIFSMYASHFSVCNIETLGMGLGNETVYLKNTCSAIFAYCCSPILQVMLEDVKADSGAAGGAGGGGGKEKAKVCKIREFLVKWQGKSYWKCSWVSELRVSTVDSQYTLFIYSQGTIVVVAHIT